jgi:hypothetical protein
MFRAALPFLFLAAALAAAAQVALVDLNTAMADRFDAMGPDAEGARLHAAAVVAALRPLPSPSITRWLAAP